MNTDGRKAVGVDGRTKEDYAESLEANLQDLTERLARLGYKPQPKQRTFYNWNTFNVVLRNSHWPVVRIQHNLCPFRALPNVHVKSRMWESRLSGSERARGPTDAR